LAKESVNNEFFATALVPDRDLLTLARSERQHRWRQSCRWRKS